MVGSYQQTTRPRNRFRLRLLLTLLCSLLVVDSVAAQENITLDDTDLFIIYAPSTSWHASTVECDSCLAPPSSSAHGGTWHDGTHIVPTIDEDDEGTVGDLDGDTASTPPSQQSTVSTPAAAPPSFTSSAEPTQTTAAGDDDDGDDDDKGGKGKGGGGKRRLRRLNRSARVRWLIASSVGTKRDEENPFEVQDDDSDDPGFQDVPVTATLNFTGEAVYVFAILPLFPAPQNTTPTFTNLNFTLDGVPHGSFAYRPDSTVPGTPTVNSSVSEKFQANVNVFSASNLEDTAHSLVVNVGVDSVLLLDYIMYTAGSSDPTTPGSITMAAPDSQRTASAVANSTTNKHNVATFAGAVGGSFGLLSCLALGLCISIKCRRRRAARRERRAYAAFAENFTAQDHGEYGPDEGPVMSQAQPAPFVPRYFPGSLPVSPPPYVVDENRVNPTSLPAMSVNRAGLPVAVASTLPPMIALPIATLDLQRTVSNGSGGSYADRPPPTPPDEDIRISLFGPDGMREERNLNGGIVGPLPIETPSSEESDPMLSVELASAEEEEERPPARMDELRRSESVTSHTFGASGSSRSSGLSEPSRAAASPSYTPYSLPASSATSISGPPGTTLKFEDVTASSVRPPTLSNSTSLPSLSTPSSSRFVISTSSPDLAPKTNFQGGLSTLVYPLLQPSRVPLPPSMYGSDVGSQETLERHDSRT